MPQTLHYIGFKRSKSKYWFHYMANEKQYKKYVELGEDLYRVSMPFYERNDEAFMLILHHVGLAFLPHLFCLEDFDRVVVHPLKISPGGKRLFEMLMEEGLAENRVVNGLNVQHQVEMVHSENAPTLMPGRTAANKELLVLQGGGKDSIVTGELLSNAEIPFSWMCFRETDSMRAVCNASASLDKYTIAYGGSQNELQSDGKYWGHKPYCSLLSFMSLIPAYVLGFKAIVMSNENSSDVGNLYHDGMQVNHQFAKSSRFEVAFAKYISHSVIKNLGYFSALRSLNELQILQVFSGLDAYHSVFVSCNVSHADSRWCGKCAKCAFIFLGLAAHLSVEQLKSIFGQDLFNLQYMEMLIGRLVDSGAKPFDCVGTKEECRLALRMAYRRHPNQPVLKSNFEKLISFGNVSEMDENQIVESRQQDYIPVEFKPLIHEAIKSLLTFKKIP